VLATARFPLADLEGVTTVALPSLDADESAALFRRFGLRGPTASFADVHAKVGGHALSIAVTASYVESFLGGDLARLGEAALARGDGVLAAAERERARDMAAAGRYGLFLRGLERDA